MVITISMLTSTLWADQIDDIIPFIIQQESGGRADAVGDNGNSIGLMQINVNGALKEWNEWHKNNPYPLSRKEQYKHGMIPVDISRIEHLFNPEKNITVGRWYLRRLKNHYLKDNYTLKRLIFAWNCGITKLRKANYDCSKMPKSSRRFYEKVIKLYNKARENK